MIPVSEPLLSGNEAAYVQDCLRTGWVSSSGEYIERFERDWARYCGMAHGIAVSSGTAALQVAVDALRLEPGDEVILPSFTIISCALAVVRAGGRPVLVDCDPETYCMDAVQVASAVTPRTRAIMPVHMYGHPVDMDPLLDLADSHGLAIIEDAAEAHGCEYRSQRGGIEEWRRCGGIGTASVFSFYANKLVTTGEGGMVLTDSAEFAERCRSLRNLCMKVPRFVHADLGHNYRLTNVQAAMGVAQVERMPEILARKLEIRAAYDRLLSGVRGLRLPPKEAWARINCWMYAVVLEDEVEMDAAGFAASLRRSGVETRPFFLGMHEQPALRELGLFDGLRLPVTERLSRRGLYLPSGLTLADEQIETVAGAVRSILA